MPRTVFLTVSVGVAGVVVSLFAACSTTTTEHRTAVGDALKTFVGFEGAFARFVARSADANAARSSIEDESADLSENIIGLLTRNDIVQSSDFVLGQSGIYAVNVDGSDVVLEVYLTGIGRTSDWTGQHSEAIYTCVNARATPPNRDSVSITETPCPEYLPKITTGSVTTVYLPLSEILTEEGRK